MIDLHCHLLPGIDDGPPTLADAIAQARGHVAAGVTTVVCTPHVSFSYQNDAARISAAVVDLDAALSEAGVNLQLLAGAEVSLSRALEMNDEELQALHLGGSDWLLLEPPLGSDVPRMFQTVQGLQARGHRILLAHPERCAAFHHDPNLLGALVEGGAAVQITAGSFTGQFGRTVERLARTMLNAGLVHVVASDAHDSGGRPPGLKGELARAGLAEIAEWSCDRVPRVLLSAGPMPPRPVFQTRARRRLFGRR